MNGRQLLLGVDYMRYAKFGTSEMNVSKISFGGGVLTESDKYGSNRVRAVDTIKYAVDCGINMFDTSEWYGQGTSEEVLGDALRSERTRIYIATKVGLHLYHGQGIRDSRPERILRQIDVSLRRLQTDYVDLYQIHWPDPCVPLEDSWEVMCRIKNSGKARYIGVSNYSVDQLKCCKNICSVSSLQVCYNLLRRKFAQTGLPFCSNESIAVMVWGPLAHGLLTGRFSRDNPPRLTKGDWRNAMPIMRGVGFQRSIEMVEKLNAWANDHHHSLIELAIAWLLTYPGITTVITGSHSPTELSAQLGGVDWALSQSELLEINNILKSGTSWESLGGLDDYGGHNVIPVHSRPQLSRGGS